MDSEPRNLKVMYNSLMGFFRKNKKTILGLALLTLIYFALRLFNLVKVPIFTDEAIYLWWAQTALNDSNWRFISLVDGKQPLFVWVAMVFMKFIDDPLLAGRLVSVFAGFFSMIGLFLLTLELFKKRSLAFFASALYIFYPFSHVYDRMALMDGMVGTFAIWGIYFSILLVRKANLWISYTLGFILGGGILTKSSGALVAYMLPFTLLLFNTEGKERLKKIAKWVILALFAFALAELFYNSLRLSPYFYIIGQKNAAFIYPFSEWIKHPFTGFSSNLQTLVYWLTPYFNIYILLLIIGMISFKNFIKEKILLLLYFLLPFLALCLFGKTLFPRYEYSMTLSLIPICSLGFFYLLEYLQKLFKFKNQRLLGVIFFAIVISYPLWVSLNFSIDPKSAIIADADANQYSRKWPAGWGVRESVEFFKNEAESNKIYVATQGTFGLLPYSLDIYLRYNPNITIKGFWPINEEVPQEIIDAARQMKTFLVFYQPCISCTNEYYPPKTWNAKEVYVSQEGTLRIYLFNPSE